MIELMIKIAMTVALMSTLIFGTGKLTEEYSVYQDNNTVEAMSVMALANSQVQLKEYKILKLKENLLLVEMKNKEEFEIHKEYKLKKKLKLESTEKLNDYDVLKTFSPSNEVL